MNRWGKKKEKYVRQRGKERKTKTTSMILTACDGQGNRKPIQVRRHAWSCGTEFRGVFTWRRPKSRLPAQFQTQAGTPTRAPTHRTLPPTRPTYSPSQNSLDVGSFLAPFSHVSSNRASTTSNSLETLSNNSNRGNIFSFSICIKQTNSFNFLLFFFQSERFIKIASPFI